MHFNRDYLKTVVNSTIGPLPHMMNNGSILNTSATNNAAMSYIHPNLTLSSIIFWSPFYFLIIYLILNYVERKYPNQKNRFGWISKKGSYYAVLGVLIMLHVLFKLWNINSSDTDYYNLGAIIISFKDVDDLTLFLFTAVMCFFEYTDTLLDKITPLKSGDKKP
jgi:hypothetical protein